MRSSERATMCSRQDLRPSQTLPELHVYLAVRGLSPSQLTRWSLSDSFEGIVARCCGCAPGNSAKGGCARTSSPGLLLSRHHPPTPWSLKLAVWSAEACLSAAYAVWQRSVATAGRRRGPHAAAALPPARRAEHQRGVRPSMRVVGSVCSATRQDLRPCHQHAIHASCTHRPVA